MSGGASEPPRLLSLADAFVSQPVNTHIFAPFLIARLEEHPQKQGRELAYSVELHDAGVAQARTLPVTLTWAAAMVPPIPLAAQREYVTEAAACGLAFALLAELTPAVLEDVADRGDRFDYVFRENGVQCGMEVSGTLAGDRQALRDRHAQKIRQLRENRMQWGGYVVVVGFARREVIVSRHAAEGGRLA